MRAFAVVDIIQNRLLAHNYGRFTKNLHFVLQHSQRRFLRIAPVKKLFELDTTCTNAYVTYSGTLRHSAAPAMRLSSFCAPCVQVVVSLAAAVWFFDNFGTSPRRPQAALHGQKFPLRERYEDGIPYDSGRLNFPLSR